MKYLLYSCLYPALMIFSSLATDLESKEKTICLNMIVKNETQVLERCLNSTKSLIDYWVIVDTGSTDGTQQLIRDCLKDIPGELYERPWVNFEYNRNEALQLAQGKADYALFLDADERLIVSEDFISCPPLELDYYFSAFRETTDPLGFFKVLLVNLHKDWSWVGVLHETLQSSNAKTSDVLPGITCLRDTPSSARSQDPQKYQKDVKVLEEALAKDPYNSRHVFYLAQSYANSKDYPSALKNYQKRVAMQGGDPEEIFWSLFMIARLQEALNHPFAVV
ncbi:MAG: glycosyltransferase, partial [Chlamydiae bacterium]|nr:glycosyltransferase [Chlamydiota bacterium]